MTFLFPQRIGRWSYLLRNLGINLLVWPVVVFFGHGPTGTGPTDAFWFWVLVIGVTGYWVGFVALPRCRDAGLPAWILLLMFVPVVNIGVGLVLLGSGTKPEPFVRTTPPLLLPRSPEPP